MEEFEEDDDLEVVKHDAPKKIKKLNADCVFDVAPIKATCRSCKLEITTFVQHEMHPIYPLTAIFVMFVFGYLSLIICPFLYLITQNSVHRCSRCL